MFFHGPSTPAPTRPSWSLSRAILGCMRRSRLSMARQVTQSAVKAAGQAQRRWRAVALDLDGTTLTSQQILALRTIEAIRRADLAGLQIIIATGRPAPAVQRFVDELALPKSIPAVCFNGACALYLQARNSEQVADRREVFFSEALTLEATRQVLKVCHEFGWCASFCGPLGSSAAPKNAEHEGLLCQFESLEGVTQERVADCMELLAAGECPLKVVAMSTNPEACAAQARAALPEQLVHIVAAEMHVEFLSPLANKGHALAKLCDHILGIALQNVIAFGDNNNDQEMLRLVGEGVAMRNAKDAVKAVAKRVSAWTNDDDGVARELDNILQTDFGMEFS